MTAPSRQEHAHQILTQLAASAQRHEVAYKGRVVCWRAFGAGAPLVLLHGGHGSWMHWVRNIPALARQHQVWVPDLPGFGDSESLAAHPCSPQRLQQLIDALIGTLDTLVGRTTPIELAGFSFGGLVATMLGMQRGDVRRLALLGPAGHGGARRQQLGLVDWRQSEQGVLEQALRHNLAALMLHDPAVVDDLAVEIHQVSCARTRFRSKSISRSAGLRHALEALSVPLLMIWGEHDVTAVPQDIAPQLAQVHPAFEWCVMPGAGHWVQFERPHEVNQMLGSWFRH